MADITGTNGPDTLTGTDLVDRIYGESGKDHLLGGTVQDTLIETLWRGSGDNLLLMGNGVFACGNEGTNSFFFNGDSLGSAGSDDPVIHDISAAEGNHLVFQTDLETGVFACIGASAFSGSGNSEARFSGPEQVQVDADGDGSVDQAFRIAGNTADHQLTTTDFVWFWSDARALDQGRCGTVGANMLV